MCRRRLRGEVAVPGGALMSADQAARFCKDGLENKGCVPWPRPFVSASTPKRGLLLVQRSLRQEHECREHLSGGDTHGQIALSGFKTSMQSSTPKVCAAREILETVQLLARNMLNSAE